MKVARRGWTFGGLAAALPIVACAVGAYACGGGATSTSEHDALDASTGTFDDATTRASDGDASASGPLGAGDSAGDSASDSAGDSSALPGSGSDGATSPEGDAGTGDAASAPDASGFASTLSSVSPGVGPDDGGTTVTLTGADLGPADAAASTYNVSFGGMAGAIMAASPTSIVVVTPPHAPGAADVVVTNTDGARGVLTAGFHYNGVIAFGAPVRPGFSAFTAAAGDFDGDGKLDVAAGLFNQSKVSIALGAGDGTFGTGAPYMVDISPSAILTGDFDKNGKLDFVTMNNQAGVFLNKGNGTFAAEVPYPSPCGTANQALAIADVNGDTYLDLVTTCGTSNFLYVAFGAKGGVFGTFSAVPTISAPDVLALADVDGDAKVDAIVGSGSGGIGVALGHGDGTFATASTTAVAGAADFKPYNLLLADFNRDGKVDLAIGDDASVGAVVILGNGDGTFTRTTATESVSTTTNGAVGVSTADLDGDGYLDLMVVNTDGLGAATFAGNGDGTFTAVVANPHSGTGPETILPGDFNGDGKTDIVVPSFSFQVNLNTSH